MTDKPAAPKAAPAASDAPASPPAAPPAEAPKSTWLTTRADEGFGAAGRFVDLTQAEHDAAPKGLFVKPSAEQLALRPRD